MGTQNINNKPPPQQPINTNNNDILPPPPRQNTNNNNNNYHNRQQQTFPPLPTAPVMTPNGVLMSQHFAQILHHGKQIHSMRTMFGQQPRPNIHHKHTQQPNIHHLQQEYQQRYNN